MFEFLEALQDEVLQLYSCEQNSGKNIHETLIKLRKTSFWKRDYLYFTRRAHLLSGGGDG